MVDLNPNREKTHQQLIDEWTEAAERAQDAARRAEALGRECNQARVNYSNLRDAEAKAFDAMIEWRRSVGLEPPEPEPVGRIASPAAE